MNGQMFYFGIDGDYCSILSTGGTVANYLVNGKPIIFPQKRINSKSRGGIPICFPFFGSPKTPRFQKIPKHGWFRNQEPNLWERGIEITGRNGRLILKHFNFLEWREIYPWDLICTVDIKFDEELSVNLQIARVYDNVNEWAPINPGFHPYFCSRGGSEVVMDGQRFVIKNGPAMIVPVGKEILIDMGESQVEMILGGAFSIDESCLILWTDNAAEYFCVEPVLTQPDDFDTTKGRFLDKGEQLSMSCLLKPI